MARRAALREITLTYLGVTAATFALTRLRDVGGASEYVPLLIGALFLLVALKLAQREDGGLERHGIDLAGVLSPPKDDEDPGPLGLLDLGRALVRALPAALREIGIALAIMALIVPPFVVGFYVWYQPTHPFALALPDDFASFALAQLIVIGLPEEALFRGYFQTRLTDAAPKTHRVLRVPLSLPAWIAQAALFALIHFVVDLDPQRLAVFFPGLLFGWVRAWRGGIGAAIVLHAASNVSARLLELAWL